MTLFSENYFLAINLVRFAEILPNCIREIMLATKLIIIPTISLLVNWFIFLEILFTKLLASTYLSTHYEQSRLFLQVIEFKHMPLLLLFASFINLVFIIKLFFISNLVLFICFFYEFTIFHELPYLYYLLLLEFYIFHTRSSFIILDFYV